MKIPLGIPNIGKEEIRAIQAALSSKWLIHGPKNEEFEEKFAKYIGVKHAVTLNSCASALFAAIKVLDIKGEIIVPSFTHIASINAIEAAGATPVFVDIDYDTLNINVEIIESEITKNTEAIMPVHIAGLPCDMGRIMKIAKKYKLEVIEDSAESIGGLYRGRKTGSFGIGCFSFFPTKNMTAAEGGMLTTNNTQVAKEIRMLSGHGMYTTNKRKKQKKSWIRKMYIPGYNFRMSNLLAAIGVEQLKKLSGMNSARKRHARYLTKKLKSLDLEMDLPVQPKDFRHVYQMYIVKVRSKKRDNLLLNLIKMGIGATAFSVPPAHKQTYYSKKYGSKYKNKLPITELVSRSNIVLPMFPQLKKNELNYIINSLKKLL